MIALDTNILIYSAQTVPDLRKSRAIDVVAGSALVESVIPVQALAEFGNACRHKALLDQFATAARISEWAAAFRTVSTISADVLTAFATVDRFKLAFYDALLCATVRRNGATVLLSEDMQDGAVYDRLLILNPFNQVNDPAIAALLTPAL